MKQKLFPLSAVTLHSGYLYEKQELNRRVTMSAVYDRFSETGRISAFDHTWKEGEPNKPHIFYDSDVAKWMEGAAYILQKHPEETLLRERVESLIRAIESHQGEDGYFNSYFTVCDPTGRFRVRDNHELYCAGHLTEAAVAYAEATGDERFLRCMEKYVDYIYRVFVEEESAAFFTPGHEEIELALIRLYRYTKKEKHLALAKHFLDRRGVMPSELNDYCQSHMPVRRQREAVGHAVRATYLYAAMADLAAETGDREMAEACRALFEDIATHKMYVTGGIGSTWVGEKFTSPYDLPNADAYAETCAAIGLALFSTRMQQLDASAVYADVAERAFYNGALSGLSLDGKSFFYENPLEITLAGHAPGVRRPITQRLECFSCSCCPPNLNRILPQLERSLFALEGDTLYVNQFADATLNHGSIYCRMETDYPRSGQVKLTASGVGRIAVRLPSWSRHTETRPQNGRRRGQYLYFPNDGTPITVTFDMAPFLVYPNSRISDNAGKVCVQAGPIVYCAESVDNGSDLQELILPHGVDLRLVPAPAFGLPTVETIGRRVNHTDHLYTRARPSTSAAHIRLIPYSCFANRGESDMRVWLRGS